MIPVDSYLTCITLISVISFILFKIVGRHDSDCGWMDGGWIYKKKVQQAANGQECASGTDFLGLVGLLVEPDNLGGDDHLFSNKKKKE